MMKEDLFMPKTKFQEIIYGLLMCFFMVLAMELYNTGLRMHGLTNAAILSSLPDMLIILPICLVMSFFFADRLAPKIAFQMAEPGKDKPVFVITARACVTVTLMCPVMSFWATLLFKKPGIEFIPVWLQTTACNFPMAFFWQLFFCGPLVRLLFRLIFERKSSAADLEYAE